MSGGPARRPNSEKQRPANNVASPQNIFRRFSSQRKHSAMIKVLNNLTPEYANDRQKRALTPLVKRLTAGTDRSMTANAAMRILNKFRTSGIGNAPWSIKLIVFGQLLKKLKPRNQQTSESEKKKYDEMIKMASGIYMGMFTTGTADGDDIRDLASQAASSGLTAISNSLTSSLSSGSDKESESGSGTYDPLFLDSEELLGIEDNIPDSGADPMTIFGGDADIFKIKSNPNLDIFQATIVELLYKEVIGPVSNKIKAWATGSYAKKLAAKHAIKRIKSAINDIVRDLSFSSSVGIAQKLANILGKIKSLHNFKIKLKVGIGPLSVSKTIKFSLISAAHVKKIDGILNIARPLISIGSNLKSIVARRRLASGGVVDYRRKTGASCRYLKRLVNITARSYRGSGGLNKYGFMFIGRLLMNIKDDKEFHSLMGNLRPAVEHLLARTSLGKKLIKAAGYTGRFGQLTRAQKQEVWDSFLHMVWPDKFVTPAQRNTVSYKALNAFTSLSRNVLRTVAKKMPNEAIGASMLLDNLKINIFKLMNAKGPDKAKFKKRVTNLLKILMPIIKKIATKLGVSGLAKLKKTNPTVALVIGNPAILVNIIAGVGDAGFRKTMIAIGSQAAINVAPTAITAAASARTPRVVTNFLQRCRTIQQNMIAARNRLQLNLRSRSIPIQNLRKLKQYNSQLKQIALARTLLTRCRSMADFNSCKSFVVNALFFNQHIQLAAGARDQMIRYAGTLYEGVASVTERTTNNLISIGKITIKNITGMINKRMPRTTQTFRDVLTTWCGSSARLASAESTMHDRILIYTSQLQKKHGSTFSFFRQGRGISAPRASEFKARIQKIIYESIIAANPAIANNSQKEATLMSFSRTVASNSYIRLKNKFLRRLPRPRTVAA